MRHLIPIVFLIQTQWECLLYDNEQTIFHERQAVSYVKQ